MVEERETLGDGLRKSHNHDSNVIILEEDDTTGVFDDSAGIRGKEELAWRAWAGEGGNGRSKGRGGHEERHEGERVRVK